MHDPRYFKAAKENTKQYPGRDAVKCDVLLKDNSTYEVDILKEEVDLVLYLKCSIFKKLTTTQQDKLLKLIEDFGDMRSEDGSFDATLQLIAIASASRGVAGFDWPTGSMG